MRLNWFRASINMAHVGAGKAVDEVVYIQAPNAVAAMDVVSSFPGAKKSRRGSQGNSVLPVDKVPVDARKWYWHRRKRRGIIATERSARCQAQPTD